MDTTFVVKNINKLVMSMRENCALQKFKICGLLIFFSIFLLNALGFFEVISANKYSFASIFLQHLQQKNSIFLYL